MLSTVTFTKSNLEKKFVKCHDKDQLAGKALLFELVSNGLHHHKLILFHGSKFRG